MAQALLATVVFVSSMALDLSHVRHTQAVMSRRKWSAANWGLIGYAISCIAWVAAIHFGMWLLPFEAAGFYAGTLIGMRK